MMHAFPRTFSLATPRADRIAAPAIPFPPLRPATYLRLCREAAGLSRHAVAVRVAPRAGDLKHACDLLDVLETPGNVARRAETLERLRAVLPFDPDVYRQLASEPPERHPRVCRGCAASAGNPRDDAGALRWATDQICARCAGEEGESDAA
ncbi:hypothetical protein [Sphingomonas sp. NPDC079357]|uniref:hypothetical protein n=1 Tax=Sphingomonas sp. NPDC079357 TaxID=3364518 RepID=UPI00384A706F